MRRKIKNADGSRKDVLAHANSGMSSHIRIIPQDSFNESENVQPEKKKTTTPLFQIKSALLRDKNNNVMHSSSKQISMNHDFYDLKKKEKKTKSKYKNLNSLTNMNVQVEEDGNLNLSLLPKCMTVKENLEKEEIDEKGEENLNNEGGDGENEGKKITCERRKKRATSEKYKKTEFK